MTRGNGDLASRAMRLLTVGLVVPLAWHTPGGAQTPSSFAAKDLQVLGRAIAFMLPPIETDSTIAIAYVAGNTASRQDAEAIANLIGSGLSVGRVLLRPRIVDVNNLESAGIRVVIAASGANGPRLNAAARAAKALCVTTDTDAVAAGVCALAITTEPRVKILVNHALLVAAGIEFATAFRMMIREM